MSEEKKDFESEQKPEEVAPQQDPKAAANEAKAAKKAVKPQWYVKLIGILAPIASIVLSIMAAVKATEKGGQTIAIVLFAIALVLAIGCGLICMILPTKKKKRKFIFGFVISMIALSMTLYPLVMIVSNFNKGGSGGSSETSSQSSSGSGSSQKGSSESGTSQDSSVDEGLAYTYKLNGSTYEITGLTALGHSLKTLNVPASKDGKSVTKIGAKAFMKASTSERVEKIILPSTITTLDKQAFYGTNAKDIELNGTYTSIPEECFRYSGVETITFPSGFTVNAIDKYAFADSKLTGFSFSGIKTVGDYAFQNCASLTSVSLGNDLKYLGKYAFGNCTALATVELGTKAPEFDYNVFEGCSKLTYYTEDGIKYLGKASNKYMVLMDGANYSATSLTIPDGCQVVYSYAFGNYSGSEYYGNNHIRYLTLPDSMRIISRNAFWHCEYLQQVSFGISPDIEKIADGAFYNTNLPTITLPEGLVSLGDAFRFTPMESINIPSTVEEFDPDMFIQMDDLEDIVVASAHPDYSSRSGYLYDKAGTKLIRIPIGALTGTVVIPDGTTTIGTWAVLYPESNITVTIPTDVTKIENRAIQDNLNTAKAGDQRRIDGITYAGTSTQWAAVTKDVKWCSANNDDGKTAMKFSVVHCSDIDVDL